MRHVMLEGEDCMDPKGVTVRALPGKPGCAYLDPGAITGGLSYVCNPINPDLSVTDVLINALIACKSAIHKSFDLIS